KASADRWADRPSPSVGSVVRQSRPRRAAGGYPPISVPSESVLRPAESGLGPDPASAESTGILSRRPHSRRAGCEQSNSEWQDSRERATSNRGDHEFLEPPAAGRADLQRARALPCSG